MYAREYDVLDASTGETLAIVRRMLPAEPIECVICGKETHSTQAVPYYCGVVREGQSEGGYKVACDPCHERWEAWNDSFPKEAA